MFQVTSGPNFQPVTYNLQPSTLNPSHLKQDLPTLLRRYRGATRRQPIGQLSQAEAARRLGVSVRNLQNWETGHRTPRGLALETILKRLQG